MKSITLAAALALGLGLAGTTMASAAEVNATLISQPTAASAAVYTETFSARRCKWVEVCKRYWHPHCRTMKVCKRWDW
jgi:hypothetical protein